MEARIVRAIPVLVVTAFCLHAQPSSTANFVDEALRPYYEHVGFTWKIERVPHFELNFEPDSEAEHRISQLVDVAEEGRSSVLKLLGAASYDPVIHIFFVSSIERMNQLVGAEVIGRSRPTQHAIFSVVAPFSELSLAHELAHEIATNLWGPAEPWLEEGLANYVVDNQSSLMNRQCLLLMQNQQWIPLNRLANAEWRSSVYSPDDAYPELGGFVQFLYETYGLNRFEEAWKGGSKSLRKVYGKKLSKLESEYRSTLAKLRDVQHDHITVPGHGLLLQEEVSHEHSIDPR